MLTVCTRSHAIKSPKTQVEFNFPELIILKGKKRDHYRVSEFSTPWNGRAFRCDKLTGEAGGYDVFVGFDGSNLCDCQGFTAHSTCKHVDAFQGLLERGTSFDSRDYADAVDELETADVPF